MTPLRASLLPDPAAIEFIALALIRPTEQHYAEHAELLAQDLRRVALWRVPIVLERDSLAVMDGHHRLAAACRLGLAFAPCLRLAYAQVGLTATRSGYRVDPAEIVRRARQCDLYPPKTTRHAFAQPLPLCNVSLCLLDAARRPRLTAHSKEKFRATPLPVPGLPADRPRRHWPRKRLRTGGRT